MARVFTVFEKWCEQLGQQCGGYTRALIPDLNAQLFPWMEQSMLTVVLTGVCLIALRIILSNAP